MHDCRIEAVVSRSPRGERGLKSVGVVVAIIGMMSLPSRGAWIEIPPGETGVEDILGRSPRGERGLKSELFFAIVRKIRSLPSRGAWIEIHEKRETAHVVKVAPLAGSVD